MCSSNLVALLQRAKETHSDALLVWHRGALRMEWYAQQPMEPIHLMSCTKSVVGLAVGQLLSQRQLDSLDQPVYTMYPEWNQGQKKEITVRMLLNHTSGLQNVTSAGEEIEPAPDCVQLALAAELAAAPGTAARYNNKAVNLIAGIIQRVAGLPLDAYVAQTLFAPLDIYEYQWMKDQTGTPYVMAGLHLLPSDLLKIGQLVLQNGEWNGKRVVTEGWMRQVLAQSQPYQPVFGLLWLRRPDPAPTGRWAYYAEGSLGQYLVVVPDQELVALRTVRRHAGYNVDTDGYEDFVGRVLGLSFA